MEAAQDSLRIHLVSDSTGDTLHSVLRASASQFADARIEEETWPFVNNKIQVERVIESIKLSKNNIVFYTILKQDLIDFLQSECAKLDVKCVAVLEPAMRAISEFFKEPIREIVGRQHVLSGEYFRRVEAMNYTINYDDGKSYEKLDDADVILIGVSRTSKSPTSMYLSYKGYKTANIPFVSEEAMPKNLLLMTKPLVVGLTIDPSALATIRQSRLKTLKEKMSSDYADLNRIIEEISSAKRYFGKIGCPIIDVSKKSVEEIAAKVMFYYRLKFDNQ